jgi:two-component system response regulator RpfG
MKEHFEDQVVKSTVFIVDDQATSRLIMENIARSIDDNIEVKSFDNALAALREAETSNPDLILTDYKMPEMDGVQFIEMIRTKSNNKDVPMVIITSLDDKDALYRALEAGATDFLVKPVDIHECQVRCRNLLTMQRQKLIIKNHARSLEYKIRDATRQVQFRELETLTRLARAGEFKGKITGRNLIRMGKFTNVIAEKLGLDHEHREILKVSSTMHDIGKIGIPDYILLKEGPLDNEEFEIMKRHPQIGYEILKDSPSPYIQMGAIIALHHHEKYDGTGYPGGLQGDEISIEARIATVADVFDALTTKRPYKDAWSVEDAFEYLENEKGKHFDPLCVDAFFNQKEKILEILKDKLDYWEV